MDECRSNWTDDLKNWIIALIDLNASVAKYGGNWWRQNQEIPTGGSLCVQLANITVFYVMSKKIYSVAHMMKDVLDIARYIDDGGGLFLSSEEEF